MRVANEIRARLARLEPQRLELVDESARHAGHAGARPEGESHFRLLIVAAAFDGRARLERQRMVYGALGELLRTDVHALSITALSPTEDAASAARQRPDR
jgi:BolA protein